MFVVKCGVVGGQNLCKMIIRLYSFLSQTNYHSRALVIGPTRELVQQIHGEAEKIIPSYQKHPPSGSYADLYWRKNGTGLDYLSGYPDLSTTASAMCFGGARKDTQLSYMKNSNLWCGTPGRLRDFFESGDLNRGNVTFLVLDEADRLLEDGFADDLNFIIGGIADSYQTCFFSATWGSTVQDLANNICKSPEGKRALVLCDRDIQIGSSDRYANSIDHMDLDDQRVNPSVCQIFSFLKRSDGCRDRKKVQMVTSYLTKSCESMVDQVRCTSRASTHLAEIETSKKEVYQSLKSMKRDLIKDNQSHSENEDYKRLKRIFRDLEEKKEKAQLLANEEEKTV